MNCYLLKLKLNGIKSINKEIELDFYKKTIDNNFDIKDYHVKAIYGANGAGKTAIIYAVDIYKNLLFNDSYLTISNASGNLKNLINQENQELYISVTFMIDVDNTKRIFEHSIKISYDNDKYRISEETLYELLGKRINDQSKKKEIYKTINGELILKNKFATSEELFKRTLNILSNQTLSSFIISKYKDNQELLSDILKDGILSLILFYYNLTIVLQETDKNYGNLNDIQNQLNSYIDYSKKLNKNDFARLLASGRLPVDSIDRILISKYSDYEKLILNLTKFVKIFKTELDSIEIIKEENENYYECQNIMVYNNGRRINKKYESTGVKKLIQLYSALCDLENGKIVFVDEFDANIHDVLLVKLVEYISEYSRGQFIFTTHNLAPMDCLQRKKYSLDFLSSDSIIISWKKNGNYSPASLYREGLIEHSPFNIESFSFLGTFGDVNE